MKCNHSFSGFTVKYDSFNNESTVECVKDDVLASYYQLVKAKEVKVTSACGSPL